MGLWMASSVVSAMPGAVEFSVSTENDTLRTLRLGGCDVSSTAAESSPSEKASRPLMYCSSCSAKLFREPVEALRERDPEKNLGNCELVKPTKARKEWRELGRLVLSALASCELMLLRLDDAAELLCGLDAVGTAAGHVDVRRAAGILCVSMAAGGFLLRRLPATLAAACFSFSSFFNFFSNSFFSFSSRFFSFFFFPPPKSDQLGDTHISLSDEASGAGSFCIPVFGCISRTGFLVGMERVGRGWELVRGAGGGRA